ncbi:M24 family metallopeptidase [Paenalkalicoccus suaedae]|uniref:M24 family metallopeptidase n=1 Tax=Paenalkalicoccus suaedae TaxID=2592382 RepID=UPI003D322C7B
MTTLNKLQHVLQSTNTDAVLLQSQSNVFYATGFNANPHERLIGVFIFKDHEPILICPSMEVNQISDVFKGEIIGYKDTQNPWDLLKERLQDVQLSSIALEGGISWSRYRSLSALYPDASYTEFDATLQQLRQVKSDEEITIMREACKLADLGVQIGIDALRTGVTETEVIAHIEHQLKTHGVRAMSFSTLVLFGEKAGDPHGNPGDRKLQPGDAVLFDLGVIHKGYCSDISRTVFYGHASEEQTNIYTTVLEAQQKALEHSAPGRALKELDILARTHIAEAGYGDFFPHRLGHGLGIDVHEAPYVTETNEQVLEPGFTFTIEPGIYVPNKAGVRIEDDVLVTESGYETLTSFTKELTVVKERV